MLTSIHSRFTDFIVHISPKWRAKHVVHYKDKACSLGQKWVQWIVPERSQQITENCCFVALSYMRFRIPLYQIKEHILETAKIPFNI